MNDDSIRFTSRKNSSWSMSLKGFSDDIKLEPTFTSPIRNTKRDATRISLSPVLENTEVIIDFEQI